MANEGTEIPVNPAISAYCQNPCGGFGTFVGTNPYFRERSDVRLIVTPDTMQELADEVLSTETISKCRDPKDNKFLEAAVAGQADYIVTRDKDLLVLHPFRSVQIIDAKDFLSHPK